MARCHRLTIKMIIILMAAGCAAPTTGTGTPADSTSSAMTVTPWVPPPFPDPVPSDFTINVRILRKACFGTAGCNITYRVEPRYKPGRLTIMGRAYTVIYQVDGGDSGPQVNNFTTAVDGSMSTQSQELTETASAAVALTAEVISVLPR